MLDNLQRDRSNQGRLFTRLEWGEYVDWAGADKRLSPFMDGRIEIYSDDIGGADPWMSSLVLP